MEAKIVDADTLEDLPSGDPTARGELCIRGALLMQNYYGKPEKTADTFAPGGWLRTGDIGAIDTDGFVYILDRAKEIIIRGGENISCAEVEVWTAD